VKGEVEVWSGWRLVVAVMDLVTALLASFNFAYFARRFTAPGADSVPRRTAAGVLAVISVGTAVEAAALLVIAAQGQPEALGSASWVLVRSLPFAGTAAMAALVARRLVAR
jgi:hypothetical protein